MKFTKISQLKAHMLLWMTVFGIVVSSTFSYAANKEPKLGVSLYSFIEHPFEKALQMANATGLKYVEGISFFNMGPDFGNKSFIDLNAAEIKKVKASLNKNKLKMVSMYAGGENVADWKKAYALGKEFGIEYITCEPKEEHLDLIDSLSNVYGIKIAIHQHKKPGAYWHPDMVVAATKGHTNIYACGDLGHWVRSGLKPEECLATLDKHVLAIHLKDINADHHDVRLGKGVINFKAVEAELKKQNFVGTVIIECEFNTNDNIADIQDAVSFYKNLRRSK